MRIETGRRKETWTSLAFSLKARPARRAAGRRLAHWAYFMRMLGVKVLQSIEMSALL